MRLLLLSILLLSIHFGNKTEKDSSSFASCSEFEEWASFFEQYSEEYLDRQRGGTHGYNNIKYNLFSDKYFKPIFGKSFDEFTASNRNVIQAQLQKCYGKKNYYTSLKRLKFFVLNSFSAREHGEIFEAVKVIREERRQYNDMLSKLNNDKELLTQDELIKIRSTSIWNLLETEKTHFKSIVEDYQLKIDRNLFITEANRLSNGPSNTDILSQIIDLEKKNSGYVLVDNMPKEVMDANQKMVNHKESIIASLMAKVTDQINSEMDRLKFQTTARDFKKDYGKFFSEDQVNKTYQKLLDQGTEIMKSNATEFNNKVNKSESLGDLENIQQVYLNFLSEETQTPYMSKLEQKRNYLIEQQNLEVARLENMRKEKLEENGITVKNPEYWNKYPTAGEMIKAVADGEFEELEKDVMLYYFFKQYLNFIGKRCPSVLPENKIRIAIYEHSEFTSVDQNFLTGLKQMPIYTTYKTEYSTRIDSIYIDPRLHNRDFMSEEQVQVEVMKMAIQGMTSNNDDVFNILKTMREINSFVKGEDCENGLMGQIGENFYRFIEQKPSIQVEILLQSQKD